MSGGWKRAKHAGRRPLLWGLVCQARCVDGLAWLCLTAAWKC